MIEILCYVELRGDNTLQKDCRNADIATEAMQNEVDSNERLEN
jgi:hypothetical protein